MFLTQMLYNFFNRISEFFKNKLEISDEEVDVAEAEVLQIAEKNEESEEEVREDDVYEDEVSLAKRTLITKLYMLEQKIELIKLDFPEKYRFFMDEIEKFREKYNFDLKEINSPLTFEINPESNSKMIGEINLLDKAIEKFMDYEVKFNMLSKRLQVLIVKLNILYNVSIAHPNDETKVHSQLERALETEKEIAQDFKDAENILADYQLKDRIVTLISYADYEIFKSFMRSSSLTPMQVSEKMVLVNYFKDFDYVSAFRAFIEDEISDLGEMLPLIGDEAYSKIFENMIQSALKEIAYTEDVKDKILSKDFWNNILRLETSVLEFVKNTQSDAKIKLIVRMNINVKESEVLTLPKTNAYLALTYVYSATHDERIMLLIKLFKNVSKEITYKEIYFLLLLFDALDVVKSIPNSLNRYLDKYMVKYQYTREDINKKKHYVLNSTSQKQYYLAFDGEVDVAKTLAKLKMDFAFIDKSIYINSVYFNGFKNIFSSNPISS